MAEKKRPKKMMVKERNRRLTKVEAVRRRQRERMTAFERAERKKSELTSRLTDSLFAPEPRRSGLMNAGVMHPTSMEDFSTEHKRTDRLNRQDPVYRALLRQISENDPVHKQDFFYAIRKRIAERKMTRSEYLDLAKMYLKPAEYEKVRKQIMSVRQAKPKVRTALKALKKDMRTRLSARKRRGR